MSQARPIEKTSTPPRDPVQSRKQRQGRGRRGARARRECSGARARSSVPAPAAQERVSPAPGAASS
eukprot:15454561-Alexandrium_andersonii.AAC.1